MYIFRNCRLDDRTGRLCKANLYKNDKRMLFQAKVDSYRTDMMHAFRAVTDPPESQEV